MVVNLVPPKFVAEILQPRVGIDDDHFDTRDLGEITELLGGQRVGVDSVVGASRIDPRGNGSLKVGLALP